MLIAGNWKMFKGPAEARAFFDRLRGAGRRRRRLLPAVRLARRSRRDRADDLCPERALGAERRRTPAKSRPRCCCELGVQGALVGHSERRQLFGESDEMVARRARTALEAGLGVIACVGETLEQRESGDMELVLKIQVEAIAFAAGAHEGLVIAYEPVWAIGTGKTATPERRRRRTSSSRACSTGRCSTAARSSRRTRPSCCRKPPIDGALVGGASLDPDSFAAICRAASTS